MESEGLSKDDLGERLAVQLVAIYTTDHNYCVM